MTKPKNVGASQDVATEIENRIGSIQGLAFLVSQSFKNAVDADDHGYLSLDDVQERFHRGLDEIEDRLNEHADAIVNLAYHGTATDPDSDEAAASGGKVQS